ncbi:MULTISPECIES: ATP-dependent helicase [unclassified Halanaerobium]|uniref:ATP-dependent helicase n=1 Tax=unclassified Halanaerobium TaxID=2641197 RepID=UPI000DF430DC|nr:MULTISPECIES: ATP-dependent helicase [unclassified Halanaerobium]RCW49228.1 DNA helicase-2/ATP-dependent DNA helicase PcrA [Halanaerobium sp. MA284_MarDTE_T2]RCW82942.1 DNA helicase-2/ATP-dependent DNA helicase PcrA [Halanaerobium sp. DL-01]
MKFKPRPEQKKILNYSGGMLAIPAVPGAGKTTVLAYLAAKLIDEKINGNQKVLIVTYMNSAAANFRKKIGDFLADRGRPRSRGYTVKTLHSLALGIIKEKPEARLINKEFELVDGGQRYSLIRRISGIWAGKNRDRLMDFFDLDQNYYRFNEYADKWRQNDFPDFVSTMISYFKLNLISSRKLKQITDQIDNKKFKLLSWLAEIYEEYSDRLAADGLLDFDDLVQHSLKLLKEDSDFCQRMAEDYKYIFEDEAQDSNRAQEEMLYLLAGSEKNFVRVGDSNQAITGTFTMSDPEIFRSFCSKDDVSVQKLTMSGRSSRDIIDLANYLVRWSTEEFSDKGFSPLEERYIRPVPEDDPMPNPVPDSYKIGSRLFKTWEMEAKFLARNSVRMAEKNDGKTVAVLMPAGYQLEKIGAEINSMGFEYQITGSSSGDNYFNEIEVILNFLTYPHQKDKLKMLFREIFYKEEEEKYLFSKNIIDSNDVRSLIYPDAGLSCNNFSGEIRRNKFFNEFYKNLNRIQGWLEAASEIPPDELLLFIAERIKLEGKKLAVVQNLALQFSRLLNQHPAWRLDQLLGEMPSLKDRLKHFIVTLNDLDGFEPAADKVTLSTIHKAKGMEWDTVFLGALTSDQFQHTEEDYFRSEKFYLSEEIKNPEAAAKAQLEEILKDKFAKNPEVKARQEIIAERIRLIYVGISRAKENLYLSAHQKQGKKWEKEAAAAFNILDQFIDNAEKNWRNKNV